tara:strand:+ start:798 stop:1037 length:240 start_codon:yes stop_codon:yes gene_type:complete
MPDGGNAATQGQGFLAAARSMPEIRGGATPAAVAPPRGSRDRGWSGESARRLGPASPLPKARGPALIADAAGVFCRKPD